MQIRRKIRGTLYVFTRNHHGWGVCPAGGGIANVSRSYQVYCDDEGRPTKCSCPNCVFHSDKVTGTIYHCKHMTEATLLYYELDPAKAEELLNLARACGIAY